MESSSWHAPDFELKPGPERETMVQLGREGRQSEAFEVLEQQVLSRSSSIHEQVLNQTTSDELIQTTSATPITSILSNSSTSPPVPPAQEQLDTSTNLNLQAKPFVPRSFDSTSSSSPSNNGSPTFLQLQSTLRSNPSLNTIKESPIPSALATSTANTSTNDERMIPLSAINPLLQRLNALEATALTIRNFIDDVASLKAELLSIIDTDSADDVSAAPRSHIAAPSPSYSPQRQFQNLKSQRSREQFTPDNASQSSSPVQTLLSNFQPQLPNMQHRHSLPGPSSSLSTSLRYAQPSTSSIPELPTSFSRRKSDSPDLFLPSQQIIADTSSSFTPLANTALQNLQNLASIQSLQLQANSASGGLNPGRFALQGVGMRDERRGSLPFGAIGSSPLGSSGSWDSNRRQSVIGVTLHFSFHTSALINPAYSPWNNGLLRAAIPSSVLDYQPRHRITASLLPTTLLHLLPPW
ncbi:hypothetical protein BT69DRAFT_205828 [Atractiella rhizophila]|nr:hypothetical protein BT69DRAFT_205828 [Atractiella rhizophila]